MTEGTSAEAGIPDHIRISRLVADLNSARSDKERAEARIDRLEEAIIYTAELYAEPLRYQVKGKLKPNLSIGFETRFQALFDLATENRPIFEKESASPATRSK